MASQEATLNVAAQRAHRSGEKAGRLGKVGCSVFPVLLKNLYEVAHPYALNNTAFL